MPNEVVKAARVLIQNPFAANPAAWTRAEEVFRNTPIIPALRELAFTGQTHDATRVVLAHGHLRAAEDPNDSNWIYDGKFLSKKVLEALPRARSAYLRVVAAAGRCRRALLAIVGESPKMKQVRQATWAACFGESLVHALTLGQVIHDHDVLIFGETGTGKEAIAQAIQEGCPGFAESIVAPRSALNVAAVPDTLVESELFGHVKGAFTGATESRIGRIRSAHGGTFFLDEVGDLKPTTQVKLLRVIETDEVNPLGSDTSYEANVRYVAATHKNLQEMVDEGEFRKDLYQRLAGNVIALPSLRERPDDIREIGLAFVDRYLPPGAVLAETRRRTEQWLASPAPRRYSWPGNVRELQNALRNSILGLDPGPGEGGERPNPSGPVLPPMIRDCTASLREVSDWYLARVLDHTSDNLAQASRVLKVDRTTVRRRARKLAKG
ncbi:MAG: sigma 54-interacting transcriptional regulator [Myxococcota bacterium]